jgi:hypothetical protein
MYQASDCMIVNPGFCGFVVLWVRFIRHFGIGVNGKSSYGRISDDELGL